MMKMGETREEDSSLKALEAKVTGCWTSSGMWMSTLRKRMRKSLKIR
jgi:hypothetical protein